MLGTSLFLNELVVQHPAAKLLVLAAKEQQKKFGDGVNLVVSIARQHLEGAKELITRGLNLSEIINGYKKASNKLGEILETLVEPGSETMDVRNKEEVILRMKAPVASKQYGNEDILCPLIADACIQVCPRNPVNFNVDNVRVAKLLGASPGASKTFRGMVLKVDTVVGSIKRIENAKVLVIAGGVDTTATETNLIHKLGNYAKTEEAKVEELIKETGAKVIVSAAGVGQMALQFCNHNKIMVLKIASQFELDCFCRTTDAVALLKLGSTVHSSYLGYVDSILVEETRGARVTVTNEGGGVATVLLGVGASNIISDEQLERAVVNVVNTYKALCRGDSRIVPGAGATEIEIARRLREFAFKETRSSDQIAIAIAKYQALQYAADAVCNALRVDQDQEPQSMFDRLMAEHHVSGQSLWQHELPTEKLISMFYESIWTNNLQPKREMEMLAVKCHGDKLFGLSPDGTLSSFDIHSSEVCWSIPTDIALDLDFAYKSSDCSYYVDSSRVFMHTKETKPVSFRYHKFEDFEEPFKYFDEEVIPSRLVTQIYVDPLKGCRISPLRSDCNEILCIRAIHGQLISYEPGTNIVLWLFANQPSEQSENTATKISTASKNSTKDSFVNRHPIRNIAELLDGVQSVIVGTVIAIQEDEGWWYLGCRACRGKVIKSTDYVDLESEMPKKPNGPNDWWCRKCNAWVALIKSQFRLQIRVQDETGTMSLSLFNDEVQVLVGRSAYQLCEKYAKSESDGSIPTKITNLIGNKYAFKVAIDDYKVKKLLPVFTFLRFSNDQEIINSVLACATPIKDNEATSSTVPAITSLSQTEENTTPNEKQKTNKRPAEGEPGSESSTRKKKAVEIKVEKDA
ncbi:T-complex protein 1 subunit theta [Tanacetum coccineum]